MSNSNPSAFVAACISVFFLASGCSATPETRETDPIRLGSVNTMSGPATYPEAAEAATAVFDQVNAEGGINGRFIDYKAIDDKGDPATATAAARELVASDEVVALVGSGSLIDCEVNAAYYEQEDVRAIHGLGVDPGCFDSPNIAPTNIGPFVDTTLTMLFGSETLELRALCVFTSVIGSTGPAYAAAIERWSELSGQQPLYVDETVPYGAADYTPYIVRAQQAGCDAIASNAGGADAVGQMKAASQQGWDDVTFLFLTAVYSEDFAEAISDRAAGVYVPAEFYPFTEDSDINADWKTLMRKNDIPLSSFSQGGYLAASFMVEVLHSIRGEVTRESVNRALSSMQPITSDMIAYPYDFTKIAAQDFDPGGWPIALKPDGGDWEKASDDWVSIHD